MIGIDLTFFNLDSYESKKITGSIEVFTCDLLDSISKIGLEDNFVLIVHPLLKDLIRGRFPNYKIFDIGGNAVFYLYKYFHKSCLNLLRKYSIYPFIARMQCIDKIWFPFGIPSNVAKGFNNYILTCHDLMSIGKLNNSNNYRLMFENADCVVTISNYVKEQIVEKFKIDDQKIEVIPNSLYMSENEMIVESVNDLENKTFLLDCNSFAPRKNTMTMIKAFERIENLIEDDLVLCGGYKDDKYFDECIQYINEHKLTNRIHVYLAIKEEQKNWLFMNCKLFITPSENEGFGRTPIEASLCLKPVISTHATALEESTLGLVHYYNNPRSDDELSMTIIEVLNHPDTEEKLNEIRNSFIQNYSPKVIAEKYIQVFKKMGWIN